MAKPLRAHIVPRFTVLALALVQLDVIVDWAALSAGLESQPPWVAAAAFAAVITLHGASERRVVADLLLGPRHAVLRRQPAAFTAYGPAAAALLSILALPVSVLAVVWYGPNQLPAAWLWMLLATPPLLLFGAGRPVLGVAAACGCASVVALGQAVPVLLPLLALVATAAIVPALGWGATTLAPEARRPPAPLPVGPTTPFGALLHRDLLALWRCDRGVALGALAMAPFVGLVLFATRVNNRASELTLSRVTLVCLAATGPVALAGVSAVARRLGPALDPPRWPTRPWMRAASLAALGTLLLVPSWAAAAVGGAPDLGPAGHLRIAVLVAAVATGAAWLVALRPLRTDHALFPWWIALCLAPSVVGPAWGPTLALGMAAVAFAATTRSLRLRRSAM